MLQFKNSEIHTGESLFVGKFSKEAVILSILVFSNLRGMSESDNLTL